MFKRIISIIICLFLLIIPISVIAEENNISKSETKTNRQIKNKKEANTEEIKNSKKDTDKKEDKKIKKKHKQKNKKETNKKKRNKNKTEKDKYSNKNDSTYAYKQETRFFDPKKGTVLRYPLAKRATVTSRFGVCDSWHSTPHSGTDFAITAGTEVLAADSGVVVRASWYGGYGNCIDIKHNNGSLTRHAHLSEINVKVGEKVLRGQLIGKVGSTGRSSGPHLHFEFYPTGSGEGVDVLPYIDKFKEIKEYTYINTKLTFIDNSKEIITTLEDLKEDNIYFQLNV